MITSALPPPMPPAMALSPAPLPPAPSPPPPPRLLDQLRQAAQQRGHSEATVAAFADWNRRFILFYHKRHPRDMGAAEVEQFLTHLAVQGRISASTQNQTLNALLFLYQQVLEIDLDRLDAVRARRPRRLPVVLAPEEVAAVLGLGAWVEGPPSFGPGALENIRIL